MGVNLDLVKTVNDDSLNPKEPKSFMEFNSDDTLPNLFEIPRQNASFVIESSTGFLDCPDVALKAQQIHGRCYVDYGYVYESALTDDGRLAPELDSSREDEEGKIVVNYLIARGIDRPIEDAGAAMRLIDVGENGTIEDLPTYKYFKGNFDQKSITKLNNLIDLYGPKCVREIAALGVTERRNIPASYELMRAVMQNSLTREEIYGRHEVYIASLTKVSLAPILRFAGKNATEILGEPVLVHADDPRQKEVYVTPVLIDPNKALDGFIDEIEVAEKNSDIVKLVQKIHFLTDGLSRDKVSKRVGRFLDKLA